MAIDYHFMQNPYSNYNLNELKHIIRPRNYIILYN